MPFKTWIGGSDGPMNQRRWVSVEIALRDVPDTDEGFPTEETVVKVAEALKQEFIKCVAERLAKVHQP